MPRTPDRFPGEREDEGLKIDPDVTVPSSNGEIKYVTSEGFKFFEEGTIKKLGVDEPTHEILDTLVHDIAETSYLQVNRNIGGFVTSIIYWTDVSMTLKIREEILTRDITNMVTQVEEKQYDGSGSLKETVTTVFTRSGNMVVSADITKS